MKIWLDMDGTIANLYAVEGWLPMLRSYDPTYQVCIVTAFSKSSTPAYDMAVKQAKIEWLNKHLPSVEFDEIRFVPYTYEKNNVNSGNDILFDDEERHLNTWTGTAIHASKILQGLKALRVAAQSLSARTKITIL